MDPEGDPVNLVDSNIFIAYFNPQDAHHERAASLRFEELTTNGLVFAEVANVLERRVKVKDAVLKSIRAIHEKIPILPLPQDEAKALEGFGKYFGRLSYTDCTLLVQAKEQGCSLMTFDRNLREAALLEKVGVVPLEL